MAVAVQRTIPSDLVVSAIRIKVAFISSIETHMFSNIFPDLSLFRDLKYPTYNQLLIFWWRLFKLLSSYHNQTLVFLRCHKNLLCKIEFNNSEDCLYLRKGFLVCSIKDRYREKVTKTENNDEALKRYFTNVDFPSKRRKILLVVKRW